jgi:hypothetical protein
MSICVVDPSDSVLIRRQPHGHFTIGALNGAPQIDCDGFERALYDAGRFAARDRADLWYVSGDGEPQRLADVFTIRRLWNEYIDLPTLQLTREQICRLLDIDVKTSEAVIAVLMEVGLLQRSPDGRFARGSDRHESIPALHMKRAARRAIR